MAGYFRSLAERSFGQSPVLHPALTLADPGWSRPLVREDADAIDIVDVERFPTSLPSSGPSDHPMRHAHSPRTSQSKERDFATPATPPVHDADALPRARVAVRAAPTAPSESSGERVSGPTAAAMSRRIASEPDEAVAPPRNAAHVNLEHAEIKATSAGPPRLEPRRDVRRPFKERSMTTRGATSSAADRHDPPDVHIHIGRIELTAVTAPPSPPKRPPGRTPMSLDEYLDRRSRKPR
jgi:hypothetical protein